jgi:hypothetical protein
VRAKRIVPLVLCILLLSVTVVTGQEIETVRNTIDNNTPFVRIPITVAESGQTIVADVVSTTGDLDTLLYLLDNNENIVDENDDKAKDDTNSRIEFPEADAGKYTLVATRYKVAAGDSSGDFELTISLEPQASAAPYRVTDGDLAATGYPAVDVQPEADWTILVYYGGDNNLEPSVLNDLDEFEEGGGSNSTVQVIALVDRNPGYTEADGNWDTVKLFKVGPDVTHDHPQSFPAKTVATIDTSPMADLGELDTGNGETLAQFLVWGIRNFPARHYVVAFGSHGAAWQGLIQDDTSDHDLLSVPELQQALTLAVTENGGKPFDLLINDACLMSSIEYFAGVSPYFRYSVASAEVVVDPALDMTALLKSIEDADNAANLGAIGTQLVNLYITRDMPRQHSADAAYLTEAVTDLGEFDPVVAAVENFAGIVNRSPAVYSTLLGEARANTYVYTSFLGQNKNIDLGNFMRRVLALTTDNDLIDAAEGVLSALDQARIYGNAGDVVGRQTSYYNIYFPDTSKDFRIEYFDQSPLKEWGKMLRNYYNTVTPQVWTGGGLELGFHLPVAPKVRITRIYPFGDISVHSQMEMGLEVIGRRIAYGDSTIDQIREDGTARRLSTQRSLVDLGTGQPLNLWRPGVDVKTFFWDVTLPVISDGQSRNDELLIFTEQVAFLDGRYREPGSDVWNDVGVVFNLDGKMERIINHAPDSDALAAVVIAPGSEFQAYNSIVTPDGRVVSEPGNTYIWPEDGLTWHWEPAPSGQYDIGLFVTAFGGTTGFTSKTVTVNNSDVDLSQRGELWTDLAFSLLRPADWSLLGLTSDYFLRSQNDAQTENLTVYFVTGVGDDLSAIASGFADNYGRTLDGDGVEITTANGISALDIPYHYDTDAGTFQGRGLAVFNPAVGSKGIGMVFGSEALQGAADPGPAFELLRDSLVLIDRTLLTETDTKNWDIEELAQGVEYPVLIDWLPGWDDGLWTRYAPHADQSSPTFAAVAQVQTDLPDASALLDQMVQDYASVGVDSFATTGRRTYRGQSYTWIHEGVMYSGGNHTWEAALYRGQRNGQPITGRMYATIYEGTGYAFWAETLDNDETAAVFADVFEPMLDGFLAGQAQTQN